MYNLMLMLMRQDIAWHRWTLYPPSQSPAKQHPRRVEHDEQPRKLKLMHVGMFSRWALAAIPLQEMLTTISQVLAGCECETDALLLPCLEAQRCTRLNIAIVETC